MTKKQSPPLDWTNPPPGVEPTSLWSWLHDADLEHCESDVLARTVVLRIDNRSIRKGRSMRDDSRFLLTMHDVDAVRAFHSRIWPGAFVRPDGISREEESKLVEEYQAKWRTESVSWSLMEARIASMALGIRVARLLQSPERASLQLGGQNDDNPDGYATWVDLELSGRALSIALSDGTKLTLEEALAWGEAYWDRFASRRP